MLERLNKINNIPVLDVKSSSFKSYGRVIEGYDFSELIKYMEQNTDIPEEGNVYYPSIKEMEEMSIFKKVQEGLYGGMDIQIGYCNGKNSTYNGFEYHKGSEINIAVSDFILVLGHVWDVNDNTYNVDDAQLFFVEKGTAIEMYQSTLHLSPCKVVDEGFRDIVILPRGTNTKLEKKCDITNKEDKLLLQKNKWVIAHKDREPLIKQGAYPGVIGENKKVFY